MRIKLHISLFQFRINLERISFFLKEHNTLPLKIKENHCNRIYQYFKISSFFIITYYFFKDNIFHNNWNTLSLLIN